MGTEVAIWHERGPRKKWRSQVCLKITIRLSVPHRTTGISLASEYACPIALASVSSCVCLPVSWLGSFRSWRVSPLKDHMCTFHLCFYEWKEAPEIITGLRWWQDQPHPFFGRAVLVKTLKKHSECESKHIFLCSTDMFEKPSVPGPYLESPSWWKSAQGKGKQ